MLKPDNDSTPTEREAMQVHSKSRAPTLKSRLRLSQLLILFPLVLLAVVGYYFFQKSIDAFNLAVQDVVKDVIPVTELKNKVQQTVKPFDLYLENYDSDDKESFLILSNEIKQSLVTPINLDASQSLANDIYRSAYLEWRIAHRTAIRLFEQREKDNPELSRELLREFYQHVIATTLALDKLQTAMQESVHLRYQKARELRFNVLVLIGLVMLTVYGVTIATTQFLKSSIVNPLDRIEIWANNYYKGQKNPLSLHSYREFDLVADTLNKLSDMLAENHETLQRLSQVDELTHLHNHCAFQNRLKEEYLRHERYHSTFSLILADIDHMSSILQNYGKQVADLTLIKISELIGESLRPTDYLARIEQDNFAILLPEVDINGAGQTAERIRNHIGEFVFRINENKYGVTVSLGFTTIEKGQALDELVQCADFSLQKAKLNGRNQSRGLEYMKFPATNFSRKYLVSLDLDF